MIDFDAPLLSVEDWNNSDFKIYPFAQNVAKDIMPTYEAAPGDPVAYFAEIMVLNFVFAFYAFLKAVDGKGEFFTLNNALSLSNADDAFFIVSFLIGKRSAWYASVAERNASDCRMRTNKRIDLSINFVEMSLDVLTHQYAIYDSMHTYKNGCQVFANILIQADTNMLRRIKDGHAFGAGHSGSIFAALGIYSCIKEIIKSKDVKLTDALITKGVASSEDLINLTTAFGINPLSVETTIHAPYLRTEMIHNLAVDKLRSIGLNCTSLYFDGADKKVADLHQRMIGWLTEDDAKDAWIKEMTDSLVEQVCIDEIMPEVNQMREKVMSRFDHSSPAVGFDALFLLGVEFLYGESIDQNLELAYYIFKHYKDREEKFVCTDDPDASKISAFILNKIGDPSIEKKRLNADNYFSIEEELLKSFKAFENCFSSGRKVKFNWFTHAKMLRLLSYAMVSSSGGVEVWSMPLSDFESADITEKLIKKLSR